MKIIPAILAKTEDEFISMVKKIEPFTDLVQLDIADGGFVPNKTIDGYKELEKIDTKLSFEVHLMVNSPETVINNWLGKANERVVRYLVHWEAANDFSSLISKIRSAGREIGCVFNPGTDYSGVKPFIDRIDLVQFMTVDPGFYGSPFLPEVLEKIRDFHSRLNSKKIQVDGGVSPETLKLARAAGVSSAVVGSYIFKSENIKEALERLNV